MIVLWAVEGQYFVVVDEGQEENCSETSFSSESFNPFCRGDGYRTLATRDKEQQGKRKMVGGKYPAVLVRVRSSCCCLLAVEAHLLP